MYKDVKKKLLSVALCICMVIGAVQVVPRAKAAATISGNTITVQGENKASGKVANYEITLDKVLFSYNGTEQKPSVKSAKIKGETSALDTNGWSVELAPGDGGTNVGKHTCSITDTTNTIIFTTDDTTFEYEIVKAQLAGIDFDYDKSVVPWKTGGALPTLTKVTAECKDGSSIILNPNQYRVTGEEGTGIKEATLEVTDGENFDLTGAKPETFNYKVAYALNGTIANGTTEQELVIRNPIDNYDGASHEPKLWLKDANGFNREVTTNNTNLTVDYYSENGTKITSIVNAGVYTIKVSAGANNYVEIDSQYFTGTFSGTYTISAGSIAGLRVVAKDPKSNGAPVEVYKNGKQTNTLVYNYNKGAVYLEDVHIYDGTDDVTDYFDKKWTPETPTAGTAILTLKPKSNSNYSGEIQIKYFITSKLKIASMQFEGKEWGDSTNLVYTGKAVAPLNIKVTNEGDDVLDKESYRVSYKYWLNGVEMETSDKNDSNLATSGEKKVVVTGINNYADAGSVEKSYEVLAVDMSNDAYKAYFTLTLDLPKSGDLYTTYYTGKAIKPKTTLVYDNGSTAAVTLTEGKDYTVDYGNNTEKGKATVTVIAKTGSSYKGSKTVNFQINPLNFSAAQIVGNVSGGAINAYTYTGKGVDPVIKLAENGKYEYVLTANDYSVEKYEDDNKAESKNAPSDVGTYKITIKNKNKNISGEAVTLIYVIEPKNIADIGFLLTGVNGDNREIEWNGGKTEPPVTYNGTALGKDFDVKYDNSTAPSTFSKEASVTIQGKNNYTGTTKITYTITPRQLDVDNKAFDLRANVSGNASAYQIGLVLTDSARNKAEQSLSMGSDYQVSSVEYCNDDTEKWEKIDDADYSVSGDSVTVRRGAGNYRITVVGKNKYTGTLSTKAIACGQNISGYVAHINGDVRFVYDSTKEQKPSSFSLYNQNGKPVSGITYSTDPSQTDFTIDYERIDGGMPLNTAAGKIFVIAVGNPAKGYFGKTKIVDARFSYYEITAPIWSKDTLEITVATDGGIIYQPENGTRIPKVVVKFNGITLVEDQDYELDYVNDDAKKKALRQAGTHTIYVTGINNYADETNKNWPATYEVAKVDVDSTDVKKEKTPTNYTDALQGSLKLTYANYTLQEGTVKEPKDYTKSLKLIDGKKITKIDGKYYVTYTVLGHGNYTGKTEVQIPVNIVDLSEGQATFAASKEDAKPGDFYVKWIPSEQLIKDARKPETERAHVLPSAFNIIYKMADTGEEVVLKPGEDYKILSDGYGDNREAGDSVSNYVTIEGIGGYMNQRQLRFTLYTMLDGATPAETSLIKNGAVITKQEWLKIYQQSQEKGLLKLNKMSFDETDGIDPEEYTLDWTSGFDPKDPDVGTYSVRVIGKQVAPHYYYSGSDATSFKFTIVDGIEDAVVTVGTDNTVTYRGQLSPVTVTPAGIGISVVVNGKELQRDIDYVITGYSGNDQIGTATVFLEGIGKYSGKKQHNFKVTYPLNSLVAFVYDSANDKWVNYDEDRVSISYSGKAITPQLKLYCPADRPADGDYLKEAPLASSLYGDLEYVNNIDAGTASIVVKNCPYFTDGTDNPERYINFIIRAGSICPPSENGTVKYTSTKYGNAENIVAEYMGENYTVDDLGIELWDRGEKLEENRDYLVYYDAGGSTIDVTTDSQPIISFIGTGNYKGSQHEIKFTIIAKSIRDSSITADPVTLTYTDSVSEQDIANKMDIMFKTPKGRDQKLVYGTDFEIEKFYTDKDCNRPVTAAAGVANENGTYYIPSVQGTYYARINGINNFKESQVVRIDIQRRDLTGDIHIKFVSSDQSDCVIDAAGKPDCTYNGQEHCPAIEVTYGINNLPLTAGRDYTVTYNKNVNAGIGSVTVKMLTGSNYDGEETQTFTIKPKSVAKIQNGTVNYSTLQENYPFELGVSHKPTITISDSERSDQLLVLGTDYTVDYKADSAEEEDADKQPECSYGGKVTMVITGMGNYIGTQEFVYYIGEDIGQAYVRVNGSQSTSSVYNGLSQALADSSIQVKTDINGMDLVDSKGEKRYAYAYYKGNLENKITPNEVIDAATYYIAVVGVPSKGTYAKTSESNSCAYTIYPRSIAPSYVLVSGYDGSYYYTGQPIEPKAITVEDTDLPVTSDQSDPQRRSVKLVSGTDYDISYTNNTSAGKASIIVTGKGNYGGNRVAYFNIVSSNTDGNNTWDGTSEGTGSISNGSTTISAKDIILGYDSTTYSCMMYNGYERIPTVSINGLSNSDFVITASNNIRPGVATLMITGINNYSGTIYKNYTIKADLSTYGTVSAIVDQNYTGYQITPYVTVTCGGNLLTVGNDYTVTYANNTNVGRATVIATAAANSYYVGTANGYFNISNTATGMEITGYASSYTYTGNAITPDVIVTMNGRMLNRGTDYVVNYSNNTNVGTATMTVTGIGSFSGTKTINYVIEAKNIENCITTAVNNYQYTGNTYTPSVTLTDSATGKTLTAGTDYTITYSNNTNPGTASITVTALSRNYTGSKVISFKITSAAVSGLRVSKIKNNSLKLSWSDQDYADGYQICNANNRVIGTTSNNSYTVKRLTSCTTYRYKVRSYVENADGSVSYGNFSTAVAARTMLNTPTLKVKSTARGKVTLTWSKVAKASGYEIYYSTKKKGIYTKLKTVSKSSARRYVDSGLASGEKYYYTIRAYRTVNGVKTYSSYNTIKSATVK